MVENYGLPYTGSKSRIAHWVIDNLPCGRVLIDAFISEYSIEDDRFEIVAEKQKMTCFSSVKSFNVTERLYTVKK